MIRWHESRFDDQLRTRLLDQATALARTVNIEHIRTLSFTTEDLERPEFVRLRKHLTAYAASIQCRGIYTLTRKDGVPVFGPESYADDDPMASPPGTAYRELAPEFTEAFATGQPSVFGPVRDEYGEFIIAVAPVLDAVDGRAHRVIGLDIEASAWRNGLRAARREAFVSLLPSAVVLLAGFLLFALRRRLPPAQRARLRYAKVVWVAVLGATLTILAAAHMRDEELHTREHAFQHVGQLASESIGTQVRHLREQLLGQVVRFYQASDHIDPEEFRIYAEPLTRRPGVEAVGWIVPARAENAPEWEAEMRAEGPAGFALRPPPDGIPSVLYPLRYMAPMETYAGLPGFDLGSIPEIRVAIEEAVRTGLPTATRPAGLLAGPLGQADLLVFHPATPEDGSVRGIALGALRLGPLLGEILDVRKQDVPAAVVCLHRLAPGEPPRFLASSHPALHAQHAAIGFDDALKPGFEGLATVHPIFVFGGSYALTVQPGPDFLAAHPGWTAWLTGVAGSLLTALVALSTFLGIRHRGRLEERVGEQAAELLATFRSIGDAVIATDRYGRVRRMNPVAERLTGWAEAEARGKPLGDVFMIINEQTRDRVANPVARVLRDGRTVQLANHTLLVARDGTERPIADSAAPIRGETGVLAGVVLVFRDQTAERAAQKEMEESEAFTRTVLDHLPVGIAVNSVNPAVAKYINDSFITIYRTTHEALSAPDAFWKEAYPDPAFREKIRKRVLEDCASGDPGRMQWDDIPIVREGEETTYISARNIPIPGTDFTISAVWDMTDRVLNANDRRDTVQFLQILVRPTELSEMLREAGAWLHKQAGCAAVDIELAGEAQTAGTGEAAPRVATQIPLQAGSRELGCIRFRDARDIRFSARQAARFARWAHSLALAVRQRQDAAALEQSRHLARIAGRAARIGGWSVDLESNRLEWSDEVAAIHGKSDGFSTTVEEAISFYAPEFRERIRERFSTCAREGRPYDEEMQIVRADGQRVWVRTIGEAERDGTGRIVRVQGAFQDITARMELEQQFRQAQKMESVGRLAGGVAHDFNNMLQTILGNAELLADQPGVDDMQRELIGEIRAAAGHSAALTRQLLAFSRKQTIQPRVLDLNTAIADLLRLLRRLLGEDIDLRWQPGRGTWPVHIDPAQLNQILANLAVNARDAIPGVGKLTIETSRATIDEDYCRRHADFVPGDYTVLAVSDNGRGMDHETLDHIFEPFFTTKPDGEGTGLGLAMVFGIVRQNGGFIHVYSEVSKGTTFRIYLPRHEGAEAETKAQGAETADAAEGGRETILVVEDEAGILALARRILEQLGYTVLAAGGADQARRIEAAHEDRIDLLLTDVVMPGMSGRDLWNELSANRSGLRCLFMSGYTSNVIAHHGILDEGVLFLQKPFTRQDLARAVRKAL